MRRLLAFVRLGRPLFTVGGFLQYALGVLVARRTGHAVDMARCLLGQAAVISFQLMTHYCNDHYDYEADQANQTPTAWSGGSRVLTSGSLPRRAALGGALGFAGLGLLLVIALRQHAGVADGVLWTFAAIGFLSWEYSAPPLRLHSTGWGELNVALVVTGLVPFVAFLLQSPDLTGLPSLLVVLVAPACLQFAMITAIDFPDAAGDRAVGKATLVVRWGARRGAWIYALATVAPFLLLPGLARLGLPSRVVAFVLLLLPLALWRAAAAVRGDLENPAHFARGSFLAVALFVAVSLAELLALATI